MSSRRRQIPWIHRNSRYIIAAIAILGALNTGYLTYEKLSGNKAACPTGGCDVVLSSGYATIFGQPLPLFGFLAYGAMAVFALAPVLLKFVVKSDDKRQSQSPVENITWLLLFMGSTAMLVFSGYLMYVLAFQLKAICIYCIASALFALSMFVVTLIGRAWDDVGQLFFSGVIVAMVTLVGTLGIYSSIGGTTNAGTGGEVITKPGSVGAPITTTSGPAEINLARHLTSLGAKMYGAYWCPHCHDQKQLFGQEASRELTYIECAADGQNSQIEVCQANSENVKGFPTWEINGKYYSGTTPLQKLAELSGYTGPTDFKNAE